MCKYADVRMCQSAIYYDNLLFVIQSQALVIQYIVHLTSYIALPLVTFYMK